MRHALKLAALVVAVVAVMLWPQYRSDAVLPALIPQPPTKTPTVTPTPFGCCDNANTANCSAAIGGVCPGGGTFISGANCQ